MAIETSIKKKPIRLVYMDSLSHGGGSNVSLRLLLKYLNRDQYDPVLVFGDHEGHRYFSGEKVEGLSLRKLDNVDFFPASLNLHWLVNFTKFVLNSPYAAIASSALLRRLKPDLVHVNGGQAVIFGLVAHARGIPVVWHIRELVARNCLGRLQDWIYNLCANRIIAISRALTERLPRSRHKITVLHNPIDPKTVDQADVSAFRKRHGLRDGQFVILLLAHSLSINKGYLFLADIAEKMPEANDVVFLLAGQKEPTQKKGLKRVFWNLHEYFGGSPDEISRIRARWATMEEQGKVIFTGYTNADLAICASDVVVCPNTRPEALGRTILEAGVHGKPVIATQHPSFAEIIDDGQTGWVLPIDADIWSQRLLKLREDPLLAKKMGENARNKQADNNAAKYAQRVQAIYDEVLGC